MTGLQQALGSSTVFVSKNTASAAAEYVQTVSWSQETTVPGWVWVGVPYLESEHAEVVVDVFGVAWLISGVRRAHHAVLSDSLCVATGSVRGCRRRKSWNRDRHLKRNQQPLRHFAPLYS